MAACCADTTLTSLSAAATAAEGILAKNPQDKDVTLTLASIYNEMEQNDKALAVLEGAYWGNLKLD